MAFATSRRAFIGGCLCAAAVGLRAEPACALARPVIGSLAAPVHPACVSSGFGLRRLPGAAAAFHNGIDFPAPEGAWVHAARAGQVVRIGRSAEFGLAVDLLHPAPHGGSFVTRYAHLGTIAPVLEDGGRVVAVGQPLGRVGRSGITYGTHVHLEVHVAGQPIDPAPFFESNRCA
jgi:murein DD-endopeptidase MepM/ murein hydrolase activator NlpD